MALNVLFICDPLDALDYPWDTSVSLMKEFHLYHHNVYFLDFNLIDSKNINELPVQKLLNVKNDEAQPFEWQSIQKIKTNQFEIIFHRKDPPVDAQYIKNCLAFESLPKKILQINDPKLIATLSEKLVPLEFEDYCIPTDIIKNTVELKKRLSSSDNETVVKPPNFFSGKGIKFFSKNTPDNEIQEYFKEFGPEIIAQDYVPEAESIGDLRVLMFNGHLVGAFLRKAKKGSRLQNFHQGGSVHQWELNEVQKKAVNIVSKKLAERGLYFLGVDFLGNKISEINFTSPMGTIQTNKLYKAHSEKIIYDECLSLVSQRGTNE